MSALTINVTLTFATSEALGRLAEVLGRSPEDVAARAIERYVVEELEFHAFVKDGEDDIAAGRTHTQEAVEAMFAVTRTARDAA